MSDADQGGDAVPVRTHVRLKHKLKDRISEKDTEIEKLKTAASGSATPAATATPVPPPNRIDFNTDDEYAQAMQSWQNVAVDSAVSNTLKNKQIQMQQQLKLRELDDAVDTFENKISELAVKHKIPVENIDRAVTAFVDTVTSARPEVGGIAVKQIIKVIGDGAEKVIYHLGVNTKARDELYNLLVNDPSGLSAAMFLGQKKATLLAPKTTTSRTPPPAPDTSGDAAGGGSANAKGLKKAYQKAQKSGDAQKAWDARAAAKRAGVDVSSW
jgi:predicted component of type VI protein secretion system